MEAEDDMVVNKASEHRYGCDATVIMMVIDWTVIRFCDAFIYIYETYHTSTEQF